jgi:hypothetical protein
MVKTFGMFEEGAEAGTDTRRPTAPERSWVNQYDQQNIYNAVAKLSRRHSSSRKCTLSKIKNQLYSCQDCFFLLSPAFPSAFSRASRLPNNI